MNECIFCKIVSGEIPSERVYEDERILGFLDINPQTKGHTLLISREHYPYLTDIPDDLLCDMVVKTKKMMNVLKEKTGAEFVVIKVVGTDVAHFHIHLIPIQGLVEDGPYTKGEIKHWAEKIRSKN